MRKRVKNKYITTDNFDLGGNNIFRIIKMIVIGKVIPLGNFVGGPGTSCLVKLLLLHFLGRQMYWCKSRFHRQLSLLNRMKSKVAKG